MSYSKSNKLILILVTFITSCNSEKSISNSIKISAWGVDVSSTKNVLETGLFEGEKYQYVVSSYPVISAAKNSNSKIEIYENITSKFASKHNVKGFPQAGLFINTELENNTEKEPLIKSFLTTFDNTVKNIVEEKSDVIEYMTKYSTDLNKQTSYFGFNSNLFKSVINGNKLSFINLNNNPNIDEFNIFNEIFDYSINSDKLSKYYLNQYNEDKTDYSDLKISVPYGGPSASVLPFIFNDDNLNKDIEFTTPVNIRSSLTSGNKDFVIFDSTTGINISDNKYKLVRMVTYGNLYLVSTGNDENYMLDSNDKIFAYGENLITGKVTKDIYEK